MESQEMEIIIDKEGRISVRVKGVSGTGCLTLTRSLEDAAGIVEQRDYTAEYYEQQAEREYRRLNSR